VANAAIPFNFVCSAALTAMIDIIFFTPTMKNTSYYKDKKQD